VLRLLIALLIPGRHSLKDHRTKGPGEVLSGVPYTSSPYCHGPALFLSPYMPCPSRRTGLFSSCFWLHVVWVIVFSRNQQPWRAAADDGYKLQKYLQMVLQSFYSASSSSSWRLMQPAECRNVGETSTARRHRQFNSLDNPITKHFPTSQAHPTAILIS
jgi:hypothetical protein